MVRQAHHDIVTLSPVEGWIPAQQTAGMTTSRLSCEKPEEQKLKEIQQLDNNISI